MKIRVVIWAALISGIGLAIEPSHAEPPNAGRLLEMYDHELDEGAQKEFELIISYIADGFGWANAELRRRKTPPLYCPPPKMAITAPQLIDICAAQLLRINRYPIRYPIKLLVLRCSFH
jgi:hypothetical protein